MRNKLTTFSVFIFVFALATLVSGSGQNLGFPAFYNMSFLESNSSYIFYNVNFTGVTPDLGSTPAFSGNTSFHNAVDNYTLTLRINDTKINITSANYTLNGFGNSSMVCTNFSCVGSIVNATEGVNELVVYLENISTGAADVHTLSNFTNSSNIGRKETFVVDTVSPSVDQDTFHTSLLSGPIDPFLFNFTSFVDNNTISFKFNVTDNYTSLAWVLLSQSPVGYALQSNDTPRMMTNITGGKTFSPAGSMNITSVFEYNITDLNVSSNFTSPGPHHLYFCVNDSANNAVCSGPVHFVIKTLNVSDLEANFGGGLTAGATLNVTYENGTEIGNVSYVDPTFDNLTMEIIPPGVTSGAKVSIVGLSINETLITSFDQVNSTSAPTQRVQNELGNGLNATMMFLDASAFLPSFAFYKFAKITLPGTDYDVIKYCGGLIDTTTCSPISYCNTTEVNHTNHDDVIPTNSACYLGQSGNIVIYADHFSGGVGGNDTESPGYTWNSPTNNSNNNFSLSNIQGPNVSTATPLINITLFDINGTGIDIGVAGRNSNATVNFTFLDLQSDASGLNGTRGDSAKSLVINKNFTCTAVDSSSSNATTAHCSFNAPGLPEGNVTVNVTFIDASNNSNSNSTQFSFLVDLGAPLMRGFIGGNAGDLSTRNIHVINDTYIGLSQQHMLVSLNVSDNVTSVSSVYVEGVLMNRTYYNDPVSYLPGTEHWNGTIFLGNLTGASYDEGSRNLNIVSTDAMGNVNVTVVTFVFDKTAPVFSNITVSNGAVISNSAFGFTYNVTDANLSLSTVDIDGGATTQTNQTVDGAPVTVRFNATLTPGFHQIKFTAVDNASNEGFDYRNITIMTTVSGFDAEDLFNQSNSNSEFRAFLINASAANNTGVQLDQVSNITSTDAFFPNSTFGIKFTSKNRTDNNATVMMFFDGSTLNWNKSLNARVQFNESANSSDAITRNYNALFNGTDQRDLYVVSVENFTNIFGGNTFEINGTKQWQMVWFPNANMSLGGQKNYTVVYSDDDYGGNVRMLNECPAGSFVNHLPTTTPSRANACYKQESATWAPALALDPVNGTMVYIPHFSTVAIVDITQGPLINTTSPDDKYAVMNDSGFTLEGTIRDLNLNTSSCKYAVAFQNGTTLKSNTSFTPVAAFDDSANYTFSIDDTTYFQDLANTSADQNKTVSITCASLEIGGDVNTTNVTTHTVLFEVRDVDFPGVGTPGVSVTDTTAQITYTATEYVNNTISYGTSATGLDTTTSNTTREKTWIIDLTGLSDQTTYFFNLTVCDRNGNCNVTGPYSFQTNKAPEGGGTGGGSGGGRGGGFASAVARDTEKGVVASTFYASINAGVSQSFSINNPKIPVTKVDFKVKEKVTSVDVEVTSLNDKPEDLPAPEAEVFNYLEINAEKLTDETLESATISFRADKNWMSKNNVDKGDVVLARYAFNRWTKLSTTKVGESSSVVNYKATTPGFSYFAILGGEAAEELPTTEEAKEEAEKEVQEKGEEKVEEKVPEPSPEKEGFNWALAVLLVLLLGGVGYFVYKKMN
jgi:PGF-pre-PGF domain-containing protein